MKKNKHFTLIELLVVVAIIGILAAMILPALGSARDKAQQSRCKGNLKMIGMAIRMYFIDEKDDVTLPTDNGSNTLSASHEWVTVMNIDTALLSCPAKNSGTGVYKTIATAGTNWNDLVTDYSNILLEDEFIHTYSKRVNRLHTDGHVESGLPSN